MSTLSVPQELVSSLASRFKIQRELGRGGMGAVLLAHDTSLGRPVAIKVLSAEASQAVGADRFAREIQLTARLVHPNIVPLFDSGEAGGSLYYVMPFIEGETLRSRLDQEGPRPVAEVMRIVADLAEALAYAHSQGIVHRDLKPENAFWYGGRTLLADFGIAKHTDSTSPRTGNLTTAGMIMGTLAYMSPEQGTGADHIDGRSDLYSLGCVAFELLTGQPPFTGPNPMAVLAGHLTGPVPSLLAARSEIEPAVATFVERLLAKDPNDRPATASVLLEELRAAETRRGEAVPVTPINPMPSKPVCPEPCWESPEVKQQYEKGRTLYMSAVQGGAGSRDKLELARIYLEKAQTMAPENARILIALADVHHVLGIRGFTDMREAIRKAKEMQLQALALDESIGEVHSSLGVTFLYWEDDVETAGVELKRAVELNPEEAMCRRHMGSWLKIMGRLDEALVEMRAAVRLAPRAPFIHVGLADVLMALGRYDEATGPLRDALRLSPQYEAALERLEMSCHRAGRHEEALDARRILLNIRGEAETAARLAADTEAEGWLVARDHDLRRELNALLELAEREDPFQDRAGSRQLSDRIVIVAAELGEWTLAMDWVERAYLRRPGRLRRVLTDLPYDRGGLAVDPRYARLLRTAGLEDRL